MNSIVPALLATFVDIHGTSLSIIFTFFIMTGNIIDAVGATKNSYETFVAGRIIFGFGTAILETAQRKLYYQMFSGHGLTLVFALDLAFTRAVNVLGKVSAIPIAERANDYSMTYWYVYCYKNFHCSC